MPASGYNISFAHTCPHVRHVSKKKKDYLYLDLVEPACNPCIPDAEAGGSSLGPAWDTQESLSIKNKQIHNE